MLLHGPKIIKKMALLPIGMLSEDAQDSRNKDIKNTEKDFLGNVQEVNRWRIF
jgi:hypothetical protein